VTVPPASPVAPVVPAPAAGAPSSMLVTGAGHGIGRAIARLFLSRGWRVGLYDADAEAVAVEAAGQPLAEHGSLDVRDPEQWTRALAAFCGEGGLDVLVNNAGVLSSGRFVDIDLPAHHRQVEVNLLGMLNGCHAGFRYLERAHGQVVNLCSASALYGQPGLATYSATKAAVKSLTEALDLEWRPAGVRVRSLIPLFVATDMAGAASGAASIHRFGVHLSADDVAAAAWRTVHGRQVPLRSPHRTVGGQTRALAVASSVSPDWLTRVLVRQTAL